MRESLVGALRCTCGAEDFRGHYGEWTAREVRRGSLRCKRCGENKNLSLHHKGGIVASKWLSKKGHHMDFDNITTLCMDCHDAIHQQARAEGIDSSQVTPEGDKGTKRDKGLPDAKE